ncbi:MAG TPA: hypothetical protein VMC85_11870 [Desulfomonilaceae bacterium]|nr:hypothetical protein [Desulfomonilaceae bacterium]
MKSERLSWNTHYLLTRIALKSCRITSVTDKTNVMKLDEFIALAREDLPQVIAAYSGLPSARSEEAARSRPDVMEINSPGDLMAQLRLNPKTVISYVRALKPEEVSSRVEHDTSRSGPPSASYVQTENEESIEISEVMATFSDEPDWGMDQNLFLEKSYAYGRAPFGMQTGLSSQAAFHMAFLHENPVLTYIFPDLRISFMEQRVRLFSALAQLAQAKGAIYWAWRFAAWAAHYLQDLTQPYHARALPFSFMTIIHRVLLNPLSKRSPVRNRNYIVNRHRIFESTIHYLINDAVKRGSVHRWISALENDGECSEGPLQQVMKTSSKIAVDLAPAVNQTLEALINDAEIDDPEYLVREEDGYPVEEKLAEARAARPELFQRLVELVGACMAETGRVTRYVARTMEKGSLVSQAPTRKN